METMEDYKGDAKPLQYKARKQSLTRHTSITPDLLAAHTGQQHSEHVHDNINLSVIKHLFNHDLHFAPVEPVQTAAKLGDRQLGNTGIEKLILHILVK